MSQENPFTAASDKPVGKTIENEPTEENYDGINISSNNKFFTPTSEESANKFELNQPQEEEFVNPMDRVDELEGEFKSASDDIPTSNERMTLKDTINEIRKTIEKIGNNGVYAEVEELDFEDSYQINIKIPKDN